MNITINDAERALLLDMLKYKEQKLGQKIINTSGGFSISQLKIVRSLIEKLSLTSIKTLAIPRVKAIICPYCKANNTVKYSTASTNYTCMSCGADF